MGTTEVATDERGRITIPKEVRARFGEHYRLVELRDGIKLLPRPDDPVAALRGAASEAFKQASTDELCDVSLDEARKQAGENVR